jgi:hypothetical protein
MQIGSAIGTQGVGLATNVPLLNTINVSNDAFLFGYQYLAISMKATDFTGTDSITVNASGVGYGQLVSNAHHIFDITVFGVIAGPTTGTVGYQTWTVNSTGGAGVNNNIALGAEKATNATTLNITDDGTPANTTTGQPTSAATLILTSFTDGSGAANWANLTSINASTTTGQLTISGGEFGGAGLLDLNITALITIAGGSGPDVFDLTSSLWTTPGAVSITMSALNTLGTNSLDNSFANGAGPESASYVTVSQQGLGSVVELSNTEINSLDTPTHTNAPVFAAWNNIYTLYDVDTGGGIGGNINMADFPLTTIVTLANGHSGNFVSQSGEIDVWNAPNNMIFNFQDADQGGNNFQVVGLPGDLNLTVNYGTGYGFSPGSTGALATQNYDNVVFDVNAQGTPGPQQIYEKGIVLAANTGDAMAATLNTNVDLGLADYTLPAGVTAELAAVGHSTVTFLGGDVIGPH